MAGHRRRCARARLCASVSPLLLMGFAILAAVPDAHAQTASQSVDANAQTPEETAAASTASGETIELDTVTVLADRTEGTPITTLGGVSVVNREEIERFQPDQIDDVLKRIPGVAVSPRDDDPGTSVNIRGLQDFGRVNVLIDGARQNFQFSGHSANGTFYVDPALIGGVDVIRGPVANAYGSGAIGGVVQMRTLDLDDLLLPSERYAARFTAEIGSNGPSGLGKAEGGVRLSQDADIYAAAVIRRNNDFRDGDSNDIDNTGFDVQSGLLKGRFRPAEGHEITLSGLIYDTDFISSTADGVDRDTDVRNETYKAGWTFESPDTTLINLSANIYHNKTSLDQTDLDDIGAERSVDVDTTGFDITNASQFDLAAVRTTLSYGGDYFRDSVESVDPLGTTELFTPSGHRTVFGGFVNAKFEYDTWLEVGIGGRYDKFDLSSDNADNNEGDRFSPKVSVGITPIEGLQLFSSYAEGLRAPALSEAIISGLHPFPAFEFLANPDLSPEIGHTIEGGVNLSYDALLTPDDAFRAKLTVFRNDVDDFIGTENIDRPGVMNPCVANIPGVGCVARLPFDAIRYINIDEARLEGVELEASYDWHWGFAMVNGSIIDGEDRETGDALDSVFPDRLTTTVGFRALEDKLVYGLRWNAVAGKHDTSDPAMETDSYNTFDVFAGYELNENARLDASIENIFDKKYIPYTGGAAIDQYAAPGLTAKVAFTAKLGVTQ
ncbi:TonB-dependent hemoglobin/transferrin/lactoferrin family receptor [Mangrovicella endophytica]|uniref:TonB-dependent hemoglobin/transferrin/lactoferrin family receptor n=1 Tax=Mangrovicella endophytica TaxID=2066697 RepID=UPI000C9EB5E8|nr:TonB-dependent hemoglobin/transferrin/lactoferrin family receptor [Mangrovicella endophytica]